MKKEYAYFCVQMKRGRKVLPRHLLVNLLVCVCMGVLAFLFLERGILSEGRQKYRIGIVGNVTDTYLGFGISALQSLDDSRYVIDLVEMSGKEAEQAFHRGELNGIAYVPDGLVAAVESGANDKPITYVVSEGQKGIASIVMQEIVDVASDLVTRSQSAIFAMQEILVAHDRRDILLKATEDLNLYLIELVLSRSGLCEVEELGMADGLSVITYYLGSILLLFLLLCGINNCLLFTRRARELPGFLAAKGIGCLGQTMGEYLAYVFLLGICLLEVLGLLALAMGNGAFSVPEWHYQETEALWRFGMSMLPVAAMFGAMQFLLYELVEGVVGSMLLQFVCGISMGYLSGFFYPQGFFPDTIQHIGRLLPTGVALGYTHSSLLGEFSWAATGGVVLYGAAFLALAVAARSYRIRRG